MQLLMKGWKFAFLALLAGASAVSAQGRVGTCDCEAEIEDGTFRTTIIRQGRVSKDVKIDLEDREFEFCVTLGRRTRIIFDDFPIAGNRGGLNFDLLVQMGAANVQNGRVQVNGAVVGQIKDGNRTVNVNMPIQFVGRVERDDDDLEIEGNLTGGQRIGNNNNGAALSIRARIEAERDDIFDDD